MMIELHNPPSRAHILVDDDGMKLLRAEISPQTFDSLNPEARAAILSGMDIYVNQCPCMEIPPVPKPVLSDGVRRLLEAIYGDKDPEPT